MGKWVGSNKPPEGSDEWIGFLDRGVRVEGTLELGGTFRVDGEIKGTVRCKERLIVGKSGYVEGEIEISQKLWGPSAGRDDQAPRLVRALVGLDYHVLSKNAPAVHGFSGVELSSPLERLLDMRDDARLHPEIARTLLEHRNHTFWDTEAVKATLPIGQITVSAVRGGLDIRDDEADDIAVIASAAVEVRLDLP